MHRALPPLRPLVLQRSLMTFVTLNIATSHWEIINLWYCSACYTVIRLLLTSLESNLNTLVRVELGEAIDASRRVVLADPIPTPLIHSR